MSLRPASAPPQRRRSYLDDVLAAGIARLSLGVADVGVRPKPRPQPPPQPRQKPKPRPARSSTQSKKPTAEELKALEQYLDRILLFLQDDDDVEQLASDVLSGMNSTPDNADDPGCREGAGPVDLFGPMITSDPLHGHEDKREETAVVNKESRARRTAGGRKKPPDISHIHIPEIEQWMRAHTHNPYPLSEEYPGLKEEWLQKFPELREEGVFGEYTKKVRRKVQPQTSGGKTPSSKMSPETSELLVQWVLKQQQEQTFTHLTPLQVLHLQTRFELSRHQVQAWFKNMRARRPDLFPDCRG